MWYVIGAILIGAAIIFGANALFPEALASVGANMQQVTGSISATMDNYIDYDTVFTMNRFTNTQESTHAGTIGETGSIVQKNIAIDPGETYVIRYNRVGDSRDLHIFTHPTEIPDSRMTHNRIYSYLQDYNGHVVPEDIAGTHRHTSRFANIYHGSDGFVRVEFTANDNEYNLTLTTGNTYGRSLDSNEVFTVEHRNIEVFQK